jgi:hypothetical protein
MRLPNWYDLVILAHYPPDLLDGTARQQMATIMDYILAARLPAPAGRLWHRPVCAAPLLGGRMERASARLFRI